MTISQANAASPAPSAAATSTKGITTAAAEQQDRFMKLLVAQMKNQDPLNPMDNAQMTSQIAQINTVAGIEKLNTTVESLASEFAAMRELVSARLPAPVSTADGAADSTSTT